MTAASAALPRVRDRRSAPRGYRTDIQGLRAVAVGLVLLYHAGVPFLPGGYVGVDVFFVISGFLITGLILKEARETGRLRLSRFYARRARRLLPATALVFAAVTAMSLVLLPSSRWQTIAQDILASNLYFVNWQLASRATDYLASEQADSPLQHFWSLAVEEQFYIVWPLLVVALLLTSRRAGRQPSEALFLIGILALLIPSLIWSAHLSSSAPAQAYFVTTTRLWEMAIGAALAVGSAQIGRLPYAMRRAAGVLGLAAIAVAALTFSARTTFPGVAALLPTLGAAGVLIAGLGDGKARLRSLDNPVAQLFGALSYSLYLWHWPALIAANALRTKPGDTLSLVDGLVTVTLSAIPAYLAYRFVEKPLHQSRRLGASTRKSWGLALVCLLVGTACAALLFFSVPRSPVDTETGLGAAALGSNPRNSIEGLPSTHTGPITPTPAMASRDNPVIYADDCHQNQDSTEPVACSFGDEDAEIVLALVGDSHAAHWQPPLAALAEENGWRLDVYTKSACFFGEADVWLSAVDGPYEACRTWTRGVISELTADPPTAVLSSMSGGHAAAIDGDRVGRPEGDSTLSEGLARTLSTLIRAGSEAVVLADTPWIGLDVPDCVAAHEDNVAECAVSREEAFARSAASIQRDAVARESRAHIIDVTDWVCPAEECAPVIGDVLVWRDAHHLTATYALSLQEMLDDSLSPIITNR